MGRPGVRRGLASFAVGLALGATLVATPVGAHLTDSISHLWTHLKPLADDRYYRKSESNDRFYTKGAANSRFVNESDMLWVVTNGSQVIAGDGVTAVSPSQVSFRVTFERDVSDCAYFATNTTLLPRIFRAIPDPDDARSIFVNVYNDDGNPSSYGTVHVMAVC